MKHLPLVLMLGALAGFSAARNAYAFDIEGQNASLEDGATHFASPVDDFIKSNGGARSLAMPLTSSAELDRHAYLRVRELDFDPGTRRRRARLDLFLGLLSEAR